MSASIDVKYGRPRFRPTVWPGTPIATPTLITVRGAEVVDDWILWPPQDPRSARKAELPADFYLRELMDLEIADLEAVADLIGRYGFFCAFQLEDLAEADKLNIEAIPQDPPGGNGIGNGYHRDNVSLHIQVAQRVIEIWVASQAEDGLEEMVEEYVTDDAVAHIRDDLPEHETLKDVQDLYIQDLLDDLEGTLNAALGKFSVGIGGLDSRMPTIYSVSFLQMWNHITEHASLRRCANEPCSNTFVRQRGRSEYGQHKTTGVKYCSRECARAQAQRELRRRRRSSYHE